MRVLIDLVVPMCCCSPRSPSTWWGTTGYSLQYIRWVYSKLRIPAVHPPEALIPEVPPQSLASVGLREIHCVFANRVEVPNDRPCCLLPLIPGKALPKSPQVYACRFLTVNFLLITILYHLWKSLSLVLHGLQPMPYVPGPLLVIAVPVTTRNCAPIQNRALPKARGNLAECWWVGAE